MRIILTILLLSAVAAAEAPPRPADFTAFELTGAEADAELLSDFLWRHFHLRGGNGPTLFNKEYLTHADLWLANAAERGSGQPIQAVHRRDLLAIELDAEGYVLTHQHFSSAHDHGWPFPLWTQAGASLVKAAGQTAGWHFQPLDAVPGWVGDALRHAQGKAWCGDAAARAWGLEGMTSHGIVENRWHLEAAQPGAAIRSPEGISFLAEQAPFLQVRWWADPALDPADPPYLEWRRDEDPNFSPARRMHFFPERTPLSPPTLHHSHLALHRHPEWTGRIAQLRVVFAPRGTGRIEVDSIFTAYDTRHSINNPIYILACAQYFGWTGDLDFLRRTIGPMRRALRHQQTVMGGLEHGVIVNPWVGHDGRPGFTRDADGGKTIHGGRGIGNNYWDLLPFGGQDAYATGQYHAATLALAGLEEAIRKHPGWQVPGGAEAFDPAALRAHAETVRAEANARFWNAETGRFVAAIDADGTAWDYGFTFLNLDLIWYGVADPARGRSILDWLRGERIVAGDTSTGADIYHWRFGPRATTRRNETWYGFMWHGPESIPWGGQVQDGGAVLGFSFYDLWARLQIAGPDDAWARMSEILAWEREVQAAGGYRAYFADGARGTTLQGCGTPGGLGIDCEFYESSLLPAIVPYGFLGLRPAPEALEINPRLPGALEGVGIRRLAYRGGVLTIHATTDRLTVEVVEPAAPGARIAPGPDWQGDPASPPRLDRHGTWHFARVSGG